MKRPRLDINDKNPYDIESDSDQEPTINSPYDIVVKISDDKTIVIPYVDPNTIDDDAWD